ncbi:MAG: alpha/beta fold hydrolase [Sphingopyxis sp.]|nr:alpha/beta fold hydrolase [Sphingopyxis sp.]
MAGLSLIASPFAWGQQSLAPPHLPEALVTSGVPETVTATAPENYGSYRNTVDFPPFLAWSENGNALLFNGGSVLYSMSQSDGPIEEVARLNGDAGDYMSPTLDRFLTLEDSDGDENYRLSMHDLKGPNVVAITPAGTRSTGPLWRPDGRQFLYKSNQRDPAKTDLYIADVDRPTQGRLLLSDIGDEAVLQDWDVAGGRVLITKVISENRKPLYLLDLATGTLERLDQGQNDVAFPIARFVQDGKAIVTVSDKESEFLQLHHYDFASRRFQNLTPALAQDIEEIAIAKGGRAIAFAANDNGRSQLHVLDMTRKTSRRIATVPPGVLANLRFNPDGERVAFNLLGDVFRRKVFTYSFRNGQLDQWVAGSTPKSSVAFIAPETVSIRIPPAAGHDAYTIQGYLYRPTGKAPAPVYVDIHGGPEYQVRPTFNRWHQYLLGELKIAVFVPNISGSNGYGKSFMMADDGIRRQRAIDDVGHILDWIGSRSELDSTRVALFGESYGGFTVLSALARFPERIRAGIDVVGIANLVTFLERTAPYRKDLRRAEFGDERDADMRRFLTSVSPLTNAARIKAPLLVAQGRNDPRVDYRESRELVESVRKGGGPIWYIEAANEGHGFHRPENNAFRLNAELAFLRRYLLN